MTENAETSANSSIVVAGDICLDVLGIPIPPSAPRGTATDNWRQTGETRTYYLAGGSMLLKNWVQLAAPKEWCAKGSVACRPKAIPRLTSDEQSESADDDEFSDKEFLQNAERFTRDEIVHSLLEVDCFPNVPDAKKRERLRILATHGFSGPKDKDPSLEVKPPEVDGDPQIIVLDDTGNQFRRSSKHWPACLTDVDRAVDAVVVHKLHRPLPISTEAVTAECDRESDSLWDEVCRHYTEQRIVVVSIDDLREFDAPISRGLSWERTALDTVWQLLNVKTFEKLRQCPHLIIRLGLNAAIYWRRTGNEKRPFRAWLIYDPAGIEGTGEDLFEGAMVGYGSAFTAAVVGHLAQACEENKQSAADVLKNDSDDAATWLTDGIKAGLVASRRLLLLGFGETKRCPEYPGQSLFVDSNENDEPAAQRNSIKKDELTEDQAFFACQEIPIFPHAAVPDRSYWRLLDTIFMSKTDLLNKAVELTATGAKPNGGKEEEAMALLKQVPIAVFAKALRTYDRREIENYRVLYRLMLDYIKNPHPPRPLSVAVFGPPGAGKSFGIKQVAKALGELGGPRRIEPLTFNLSQYQSAEQLSDAFHLVRDFVLRGKIPLVFFDEFDTSLGSEKLGWLRYFLAPMQDAEFLDNGTPHPIGQAIFVFAGGTCDTYAAFAKPFLDPRHEGKEKFKSAKGPDFLSRLRGTLDIPGLELNAQFDVLAPVETFPNKAAILLRRAGILAHQLKEKAAHLKDESGEMHVSSAVLRTLLHLPHFVHGNRSFEALLDMSQLVDAHKLNPSRLPSASHVELHASSSQLSQLLATHYPFPPDDRELIAKSIHARYLTQNKDGDQWEDLTESDQESNREQADDIAVKLRSIGLWFRKQIPNIKAPDLNFEASVEGLAKAEHDRWIAEKRRLGWIPAPCQERKDRHRELLMHNTLLPWDELTEKHKNLDRDAVRQIPNHLAAAGYEVIKP